MMKRRAAAAAAVKTKNRAKKMTMRSRTLLTRSWSMRFQLSSFNLQVSDCNVSNNLERECLEVLDSSIGYKVIIKHIAALRFDSALSGGLGLSRK